MVSNEKSANLVKGSRSMKVDLHGIYAFAQNGMTSAEMLQRTYLWFIEEDATAKGHGHRFAQAIGR